MGTDDAVDLSCQHFKGALLLGVVSVAVIGAPDPTNNVAETALVLPLIHVTDARRFIAFWDSGTT